MKAGKQTNDSIPLSSSMPRRQTVVVSPQGALAVFGWLPAEQYLYAGREQGYESQTDT